MRFANISTASLSFALLLGVGLVPAQPGKEAEWVRVTEDERAIKIEKEKGTRLVDA